MIDEQIAILEHRLTSKQVPPTSTLLDHMVDDIDIKYHNEPTKNCCYLDNNINTLV